MINNIIRKIIKNKVAKTRKKALSKYPRLIYKLTSLCLSIYRCFKKVVFQFEILVLLKHLILKAEKLVNYNNILVDLKCSIRNEINKYKIKCINYQLFTEKVPPYVKESDLAYDIKIKPLERLIPMCEINAKQKRIDKFKVFELSKITYTSNVLSNYKMLKCNGMFIENDLIKSLSFIQTSIEYFMRNKAYLNNKNYLDVLLIVKGVNNEELKLTTENKIGGYYVSEKNFKKCIIWDLYSKMAEISERYSFKEITQIEIRVILRLYK